MSEPLAYLHGRFLPQSQATLPFHDAGFVFGATVTDFCRTFRQKPYLLDRHMERLRTDAGLIGITVPLSMDALMAAATQLVANNAALLSPEQELALVSFVTPGPIGYYVGQEGTGPPTVGMHTFPLPLTRYARFFSEGPRLFTPSVLQPAQASGIKHRSRLHWWLASQEVRRLDSEAIALLLDRRGNVTETALANLLIVKDGRVLTPLASTVLWGISLDHVRELCSQLSIPFTSRPLSLADCISASEAMLCGSAFCLAGVSRINGHAVPWPGPVFEKLLAAWSAEVGLDIRGQFFPVG
jgi:branched-chain amino acid aminotransferase